MREGRDRRGEEETAGIAGEGEIGQTDSLFKDNGYIRNAL